MLTYPEELPFKTTFIIWFNKKDWIKETAKNTITFHSWAEDHHVKACQMPLRYANQKLDLHHSYLKRHPKLHHFYLKQNSKPHPFYLNQNPKIHHSYLKQHPKVHHFYLKLNTFSNNCQHISCWPKEEKAILS